MEYSSKGAPPVGPRFFKKRSDHMGNLLKIYFLTRWIRICKKIGGLPLRFARKLHLKIDDSRYTEFPYEWWRIQFYRHLVVKYGRTLYIFPLNQACIFQPDGFQPRFNCLTSWFNWFFKRNQPQQIFLRDEMTHTVWLIQYESPYLWRHDNTMILIWRKHYVIVSLYRKWLISL